MLPPTQVAAARMCAKRTIKRSSNMHHRLFSAYTYFSLAFKVDHIGKTGRGQASPLHFKTTLARQGEGKPRPYILRSAATPLCNTCAVSSFLTVFTITPLRLMKKVSGTPVKP